MRVQEPNMIGSRSGIELNLVVETPKQSLAENLSFSFILLSFILNF